MPPGREAEWRADVTARMRAAIAEVDDGPQFSDLLLRLAARKGRLLHAAGQAHWPRLVVGTCEALGQDWRVAVWPAAGVEFIACAGDVVDDLVDGDWDCDVVDAPRALNASFGLTWLAQRCAQRAAEQLGIERSQRIGGLIAEACLSACSGEDLDLLLERDPCVSEEQAHEASWRKSGSLVAMACQVGAACATDEAAVIETAGLFGAHSGMVAQLLNDIAGVHPDSFDRSTDLARRKKTLPVAYAIQAAREEGISEIMEWYDPKAPRSSAPEEELAHAMASLGGLHYAWVVADVHRREALTALRSLTELTGRKEVLRLARLVPALRPGRNGAEGP